MLHEPIPAYERAHSTDEVIAILEYIWDFEEGNPTYMPAYALELQILMGSRISEPAPLKWSYIDKDYIYLSKAQFVVKKTETEKQHLEIVNRTKNKKNRRYPRTDAVNAFLEKLEQVHKTYNLNSEYLFPANSSTGVVAYDSVYGFYRKIITNLGIKKPGKIMGPHSFRRNAVTDTVNATDGNFELASLLYGNSARVAKDNYYTGYDKQIALDALNKRKFTK